MLSGRCLGAASIEKCYWCLEAMRLASEHLESVLNTKNYNISRLMDFVPWLPNTTGSRGPTMSGQGKQGSDLYAKNVPQVGLNVLKYYLPSIWLWGPCYKPLTLCNRGTDKMNVR